MEDGAVTVIGLVEVVGISGVAVGTRIGTLVGEVGTMIGCCVTGGVGATTTGATAVGVGTDIGVDDVGVVVLVVLIGLCIIGLVFVVIVPNRCFRCICLSCSVSSYILKPVINPSDISLDFDLFDD